jgi:hypothetical protein
LTTLGSTTNGFFIILIPFVLKHILHVTILMTIYDLVSDVTINMTRILHKFLYFDLLSGNLRNYKNRFFLSFDFACFNIVICSMIVCTIHSCLLSNNLRFLS